MEIIHYFQLVGHVIPSGGIAITGQAQSQLGGGFQEGYEAPKGTRIPKLPGRNNSVFQQVLEECWERSQWYSCTMWH